MNATQAYKLMLEDIASYRRQRATADASSPMQQLTVEAPFCQTYTITEPKFNVVRCRSIDETWARANVLHFFTASEEAGALRKYNRLADRFLDGDRLVGAYGPIAMPQIGACIELLRRSPQSRRAVVSMGPLGEQTINSPPCWSFLHFMQQDGWLHLAVYQRSLNFDGVMPYDCVLLTNVLLYVAETLGTPAGLLHWTIGSLHSVPPGKSLSGSQENCESVVYPASVLGDPLLCKRMLEEGTL